MENATSGGLVNVRDFIGVASTLGTLGDDDIFGTAGPDIINGLAGNDIIRGLPGDDELLGADGDDFIIGREGEDILDGGPDNDTLIGGKGNDLLRGGLGADSFRFGADDGTDVLIDFEQGVDKLVLNAANLGSFADVTITDDGVDSTVSFASTTVVVEGVVGLVEGDFLL